MPSIDSIIRANLLGAMGLAVAAVGLVATASGAEAGTLENLERERARTVIVMQDASLSADERLAKMEAMARRLRDLEQMTMRDETLVGRNTPVVEQAFEDYERTFLLHAAAEEGVTLSEQWFAEVGLSTDSLMATRAGRR